MLWTAVHKNLVNKMKQTNKATSIALFTSRVDLLHLFTSICYLLFVICLIPSPGKVGMKRMSLGSEESDDCGKKTGEGQRGWERKLVNPPRSSL